MTRIHVGIMQSIVVAAWWCILGSASLANNDVWKAAVSGTWGLGSNWLDNSAPGVSDQATFNLNGNYTVSFIGNAGGIQALDLTNGANVTLTSNSAVDPNTLFVNSVSGTQDVHVNGATLNLGISGGIVQTNKTLHLTAGRDIWAENAATLNVRFGSDVISRSIFISSNSKVNVLGSGSTSTSISDVRVGLSGTGGELTISAGGSVSNNDSRIGDALNSTGKVTVTGIGSTWRNGGVISIGTGGSGTMMIQDGGSVTNSNFSDLGANSVATGTVAVSGAGSTWTNSGPLRVGNSGTGALSITTGGSVTNGQGVLGLNPGSSGTADISGSGSTWTNNGNLYVGFYDRGTMTITGSGSVLSAGASAIGYSGFSTSTNLVSSATVDGAGSSWTNNGSLSVGDFRYGRLTISNGGVVGNTFACIGCSIGQSTEDGHLLKGDGDVSVTGPGSTWTNNGFLNVGSAGTGTLTIAAGAVVSSTDGFIGTNARTTGPIALQYSSTGTATVAGTGSMWVMSGRLSIGGNAATNTNGGSGTLTIGPGGTASVAADTVLFANGLLKLQGGTLATTEIDVRSGQFQWTSGTLQVGLWHSNLTNPIGGILAPGRSAGITTIEGIYTQQGGAALEIEIGGTMIGVQHDFVNVAGSAVLGGVLRLKLLDGFSIAASDTFTVLNAPGGIAGVFSNVTNGQRLATIDNLGSFLVNYGATSPFDPNQVVLTNFVPAGPPGDYNNNGIVDTADYVIWRKTDGSAAGYNLWRTNFGKSAGAGTGAPGTSPIQVLVPEPATFVLLMFAAAGWCLRRVRAT